MTVSAIEATPARLRRRAPLKHRSPAVRRADRLIPIGEAARLLGYSADTLRRWHDEGHMPAVITPGGQWSTYQSFIDAVLASARPKQAGSIEEIARDWFAAHAPEAVA
jgi:excisionase family DNA binding protein